MRASAKFMLTAVAVCLTIGVLMVGVFAATSGNMQLTSLVKWQSIGVEMDIHGKVTGNHSGDAIASTYEDSLTLANDSKSSAWSIGAMNFVMEEDSTNQVRYSRPIVMRFGFTNNSTHKVNIYYYFAEAPTVISNVNYEYQLAHGTLGSGETWESDFFNANYSGNMSVSGVSDKYYSVHKDTEQNFVAPGETVVFEIRFTVAVFTQSISTAALTTSLVFQNSPREGMKPTIYIDGVEQTNVAIAGTTVGDYLDALDGSQYPGYFYDADLTIYADEDDIVTYDTKLYTKSATLDKLTFTSNGDGTCSVVKNGTPTGEVVIPQVSPAGDSVTSIGSSAFGDCTSLMSITIPDSVTSIGEYAFKYCRGLKSITIPDSVTSIGEYAFYYCESLTSITIPDGVTSIGDNAFSGCRGLTSITIPNSVTSIGSDAFSYCRGLTSITIPDSVTSIGSDAFKGCSGLTSITIGDGVTTIGNYAFRDCASLTSVTIPNSVTSIGDYAFYYCTGLTSITIGDGVSTIGGYAFSCSGLTSIVVSGDNPVYDSRNNCNAIIETASNTLIAGCKNTVIPNNVTSIGSSAFAQCSGLTSITIPDSVTSIGSSAFSSCTSLTSITIGDGVTTIGNYAFRDCASLTSVTIPNSVTSIGDYAFYYCTGLTSITIPDSVTSIGSNAFCDCSGLTSIVVSGGNTIYDSRNNCNAIIKTASNTLIRGCKNTVIPNNVTSIRDYAFKGCSGLTSITIPDSVISIGYSAFSDCTSLTSITIPDSVTSIGEEAFSSCTGLTSITIGDSVPRINSYAFEGCTSLTSITIGDSVTSIGFRVFDRCTSLTSIYIPSSVTTISASSYYNSPFKDCSSSLKIYCGASSKPSGWGTCWNYYNYSTALSTTWGVTREQYNSQYA